MAEAPAAESLVNPLEIVIIGAGMGGLTAARRAQLAGFNVTVYERVSGLDSGEYQSDATDLHPRIGVWALKKAELGVDEGKQLAEKEGRIAKIAGKNGNTIFESNKHRLEINKSDLRRLLADSLSPDTIHWGCGLNRVEALKTEGDTAGEQLVLHFDNGQQKILTNALLIGADGPWSSVRSLLTPAKPLYAGVTVVELVIANVADRFPAIAAKVGGRSLQGYADSKGIIAQLHPNGTLHIHLVFRLASCRLKDGEGGVLSELDAEANAATKRGLLVSKFDGWADCWLDLIRAADDSVFIERIITALPPGTTWTSRPNITLVGDAAHQMAPFSGVGGDLAVRDAAYLVELLIREQKKAEKKASKKSSKRSTSDWQLAAIRPHEARMRRRAGLERPLTNAVLSRALMSPNGERTARMVAPAVKAYSALAGLVTRIFPRAATQ